MTKIKEILSLKNPATRRTLLTGGAFILGFIVLAIVGTQVWEWSNSTAFCTNVCHDVHPEEPEAYADSYHARVKCVECHMSRVGTLYNITLKASHAKHLPAVIFKKYEHPQEAETLRPASESCEQCHWPPTFHGDSVLQVRNFQQDESNTEEITYLILKTGGGERSKGLGRGIHWHIENEIEYVATEEHNQHVRWIRATLPDGRTVEYYDAAHPLSDEEIANAEKHTMDCVDCHNRMGHPFLSPSRAIDQALTQGRLDSSLPFIKKELMELLDVSYDSQEAALAAVESFKAQYESKYPEAADSQATAIEQAVETAKELVPLLVFEESGVTWESFPNDGEHKEFPGCFRCHDGKHLSKEGESIRLHCNICHTIPIVVGPGERPPDMPVATVQEPDYHLATNFMADHRFQANDECVACHGEINFGSDDSSFCNLSACHGQAWPLVELDAAFPHPIELTDTHAEVWCHDCHEGERKPEFQCANCHEPPMASHFEGDCQDCHSPEGFEQAALAADFEHPVSLANNHATLDCIDCHTGGQSLVYECANCHEPPSASHFGPNCEECHTPTGFAGATIPPGLHPIELTGGHLRATCDVCHAEGTRVPEYICSNCHRPPDDHLEGACDTCHTPEGWPDSATSLTASAPEIPHGLDGMEDCSTVCHNPEGEIEPMPASHKNSGYVNEQCQLCHKPAP